MSEAQTPKRKCKGITTSGKQCSREVKSVDDQGQYCWQHQSTQSQSTQLTQSHVQSPDQPKIKPTFRRLKLLGGASNMYYFKNVGGRNILLLGESHTNYIGQKQCQFPINQPNYLTVLDWLKNLATSAPTCVDLMTESDLAGHSDTNGLTYSTSPLTQVLSQFSGIAYGNPTDSASVENYGQLRFHNIDFRVIRKLRYPLLGLSSQFWGENHLSQYLYPYYTEFVKYLFDQPSSSETIEKFENLSIYFQMKSNNISKDEALKRHQNYFKAYFEGIRKAKLKLDPQIDPKKLIEVLLQTYTPQDINEYGMRSIMNVIPMDYYFILRLFTSFDQQGSKLDRGPKGCKSKTINHAIVFVGPYHMHLYAHFIHNYFNVLPDQKYIVAQEVSSKSQCVPFEKPFDFFD